MMKSNEIKKALECCPDYTNCLSCPCFSFCGCTPELFESTFAYIEQLETDREECREEYIKDYDELESKLKYSEAERKFEHQRVMYLQTEVERLKSDRDVWQTGYVSMEGQTWELSRQLKTAKSEAIKEFAERLKKCKCHYSETETTFDFDGVTVEDIDNLIKEMAGE